MILMSPFYFLTDILYKWLIIGSFIGVPFLLILTAGIGLCCYYCPLSRSPWGPDRHINLNDQNVASSVPTEEFKVGEYRPIRPKPKRVTVISLPPSSSPSSVPQSILIEPRIIADYYRMNRTPDYERNINNVHVSHFRWSEQ